MFSQVFCRVALSAHAMGEKGEGGVAGRGSLKAGLDLRVVGRVDVGVGYVSYVWI